MNSVLINELILVLSFNRNDNGVSGFFIQIYSDLLHSLPLTELEIKHSGYYKWITDYLQQSKRTGGSGFYRGAKFSNPSSVLKTCRADIDLFYNIRDNGLRAPIRVFSEPRGIEIDGYHRLCSMKHLGHTEIPYALLAIHPCETFITEKDFRKILSA